MVAVSSTTAYAVRPRPGRSRTCRGRAGESRLTSGSRRSVLSHGGREGWPAGMITKTHRVDLGLELPEKKKKKKKKVLAKEPESQYSVLNNDNCFADISSRRAMSSFHNVGRGQASEMPLGKKKKKKKKGHSTHCEELLKSEPTLSHARRTKSSSPGKQTLSHSEFLTGEKKKKRKSLSLSTSHCSKMKTSPDHRQSEEVTRVGKKLKKHKKEKKAQDTTDFSIQDPWLYEAGDSVYTCSVGKEADEHVALGQKRKQGSPREHSMKMKKKKKVRQGEDTIIGHSKPSRSMESSPRKESKKKPVKVEVLEYIPIGDGPKVPVKKKMKSKKKVELPVVEEPALKRKKKKKRKECGVAEDLLVAESDTDLEVVLEKKGNTDEACIDQMRRKALQEEIDRESGKTETSEPRKWMETQFGQWDTAGFDNEEQKLKFLKLMGGFKHLSPSFSRPPSATGRPNMALSKKAADTLQRSLQQDYDRAMSWKYSRGAGLGFSAAQDKVFYIDRNASRSIRLED